MTFFAFQMSNDNSLFVIMVIIAICFAIMAIAMAMIAIMVFRMVGVVREVQQKVEPLIQSANNISVQGKEIAEQFTHLSEHLSTATRYFADSASIVRDELAEIKVLIGQTAIVARDKVQLVSQTIDRTNGQIKDTTDFIQHRVVEPARELAAIMAGLRRGLEVLLAPSPKQLNSVYNNDEMFIG